jgi:actin cytoskeleton-regulatory complex protein SLA1
MASPPVPSNPTNNTSPANVFAQMKSGTFANDYDGSGLASNSGKIYFFTLPVSISSFPGINGQAPGWGQSYQGYTRY